MSGITIGVLWVALVVLVLMFLAGAQRAGTDEKRGKGDGHHGND